MKTLVFGVIYKGVKNYLDDYFNSINNQTTNDFDLLIIEDGIELPNRFLRDRIIKKTAVNSTPAEIRENGINYAKENGYDLIVFADTDDYFSLDRIKNSVVKLNNNSFLANALISVDDKGSKLNLIEIPSNIDFIQLLKSNYFGLSNTALNIKYLPKNFYIPDDIIAVDWWLFSLVLLFENKYIVDYDSITFYRQHSGNTTGFSKDITLDKIKFGLKIKLMHYSYLLQYILKNNLKKHTEIIKNKIQEYDQLKEELEDNVFANIYCKKLNEKLSIIKKGWWSEIITLNELEKL